MRAFLIFHEYIQKIILFEISPIKTQNNTENCINLGTNITNEASKEWTLRLNPQKASMFSNERKFRFLDLSNPKPNQNEKSLKTPCLYTKIHHLFIVPKNFKFLLILLFSLSPCLCPRHAILLLWLFILNWCWTCHTLATELSKTVFPSQVSRSIQSLMFQYW